MKFNFSSDPPAAAAAPSFPSFPSRPDVAPAFPGAEASPPTFPVVEAPAAVIPQASFPAAEAAPAFPPAPVEARQRPQDEWTPRPGVLMDHMTLLVKRRRAEQRAQQEYVALINKLKVQHPELAELELRVSEAGRAADEAHKEVEEMARQAKTSCQVPGCKVSYSNPKTKVCSYTDLAAAWATVDMDCPEVIKKEIDVKALEAAEKVGRAPAGICSRVVTEKAMTSAGRLKIEVEL